MIVLAPDLNDAFQKDLEARRYDIAEELGSSVYRVENAAFPILVFATDQLRGLGRLAISLMNRVCLRDPESIIDELTAAGAVDLLSFALQRIKQFDRLGENFSMQHTQTEEMARFRESVLEDMPPEWVEGIPVERRLQGIPAERRLQGIPTDQRLQDVPVDELVEYLRKKEPLTPEQRKQLRSLLDDEESN